MKKTNKSGIDIVSCSVNQTELGMLSALMQIETTEGTYMLENMQYGGKGVQGNDPETGTDIKIPYTTVISIMPASNLLTSYINLN